MGLCVLSDIDTATWHTSLNFSMDGRMKLQIMKLLSEEHKFYIEKDRIDDMSDVMDIMSRLYFDRVTPDLLYVLSEKMKFHKRYDTNMVLTDGSLEEVLRRMNIASDCLEWLVE